MSRGPGKVQKAIREVFTAHPSGTFTVFRLAQMIYGELNPKDKHRVAIRRAADPAAAELGWERRRIKRDVHYCSPASVLAEKQAQANNEARRKRWMDASPNPNTRRSS